MTSKTQVAFTWSAPSDDGGSVVIDYAIEMDINNDGSYSVIETGFTSTSFTKTGLNEGQSYNFRLRSRNSIGLSVYSSPFTIKAAITPDEPTTLSRNDGSTTKTQVAFTW